MSRQRKPSAGARIGMLTYHALMLAISAVFLLPFYWMTISAFKTNAEIFSNPVTWLPDPIRWENMTSLFTREDFPFVQQFVNSVLYAGTVAVLVCLSCSLAAYSFGCLRWRGQNLVFGLTVCALLMPTIVTFLPIYLAWSKIGLTGTYWPLITPFLFGDAFFIFMLRQFFMGVPRELLDAARLDGASEFRIWWQIVMPQLRTPLIIVGLFATVYTWNEFFLPLIYLQDREAFPLSVGLFTFQSQRAAEWSVSMMGALLTALPMVALFLFTQRLFQRGLSSTGLRKKRTRMGMVQLSGVRKFYGALEVIKGIDLTDEPGELVVFVGPSGCGKSTLLRMMSGLEDVDYGRVEIARKDVTEAPPAQRGVAMVFQNYALYPHMTAYDNLAYGLRRAGLARNAVDQRVQETAALLQISDLLPRKPKAMSGGQRQRVAIGRAIVRKPEVFLFDEPLSNLDAALRVEMRSQIARLHQELAATMIFVTHDQVEAMTLADRIVVLNAGRVEQIGTPREVYHSPANLFVAGFIGSPAMNLLPATLGPSGVALVSGPVLGGHSGTGEAVTLGVRPDRLTLTSAESAHLSGEAKLIEHLGDETILHLALADGGALTIKLAGDVALTIGARVHARIDMAGASLFGADGRAMQLERAYKAKA